VSKRTGAPSGAGARSGAGFIACNPDRWGDSAWGKGSGNSQARGLVAGASFDSFPGSSGAEFLWPAAPSRKAGGLSGTNMTAHFDLLEEDTRPSRFAMPGRSLPHAGRGLAAPLLTC